IGVVIGDMTAAQTPASYLEVTGGTNNGSVTGITSSNYSGYGNAAAQFAAKNPDGNFNMGINASGGTNSGFFTSTLGKDDAYINNALNAAIAFGTNNIEHMRLTSAGNVGIG